MSVNDRFSARRVGRKTLTGFNRKIPISMGKITTLTFFDSKDSIF